jgi:hypothetical protein
LLSRDSNTRPNSAFLENHRWANDIKETQGFAPNYPIIGDPDLKVAKLYGMLPAAASGDASKRTPADNQTVRNVFVIGPDKKVKLSSSTALRWLARLRNASPAESRRHNGADPPPRRRLASAGARCWAA